MRKRGALFFIVLPALFSAPIGAHEEPAQAFQLNGIVVDVTGAAVSGAEVTADDVAGNTDDRGRFQLAVGAPEVSLRVRAAGFNQYSARVRVAGPVRVVLHPAGFAEAVTVRGERSGDRLADTAAAVSVATSAALLTSAATTVDDALRSVPGFSLFRRSSSRVANPTTQGVTMRGLAASGASRALVTADGVPLNDPYGGWVYWDRVPQAAIDRVEVVRGSGSESIYGLGAIGGNIQMFTLEPRSLSGRFSAEGGQHGMARVSGYVGGRRAEWDGFVAGERYVLNGFPIVAPDERGPVDVNAGLRYSNAVVALGWTLPRLALGIRTNWLDEDRANGTPLQKNDTNLRSIAVNGRASALGGLFAFVAHGGSTSYDQSFSSVSPDRATERLTFRQRVASDSAGGSLQWFREWSGRTLLVGGEVLRVSGGGAPADTGIQHDAALYTQFGFEPVSRLRLVAGARAGRWSTTPEGSTGFDQRSSYVVPRISATWAATSSTSIVASWSWPQRTPTLNELYRDFQVGNVFTQHNAHLRPEDAQGFEAGLLARRGSVSGRAVAFWTTVDDAITNVTLGAGSGQIVRQRRNAGTIRARGVEAEAEWRPSTWSSVIAAAAFSDSRFTSSDEPGLAGKRVAQVPRWQGALSARFTPGRAVATVDWRSMGAQFDDDRNQFVLRRASVFDVYIGASLARGIQPFVAAENLFDAEVDVGRTPVRTTGTPRSIRAGVRLLLP
ncbi:MAG: TonB-dependent receptor [Acidobacteriota bacterium]